MRLKLSALSAVVLPAVAVLVASPPAGASVNRACVAVHAVGVGHDNGVNSAGKLTTTGTVLVHGVEVATSQATFTPGSPSAGTLPFTGPIVFTSEFDASTLTAQVNGSVDLSTGRFTAVSTSVTGTGVLRPASGKLRFNGAENLKTGAFRENISGKLCAPRP